MLVCDVLQPSVEWHKPCTGGLQRTPKNGLCVDLHHPLGSQKVNACSRPAKKMKSSVLARCSPKHAQCPAEGRREGQ